MSAANIEIRRLGAEDAETFRDIRLEALRCNPEAFGSTFEAEKDKPLSWFCERLGTSHVHGAFRAAKLIGIAVLVIQQSAKMAHKGALVSMYVRPQARRLGVGRRLVEAIIDTARWHVELVQLDVLVADVDVDLVLSERVGSLEEERAQRVRRPLEDLECRVVPVREAGRAGDDREVPRGRVREGVRERVERRAALDAHRACHRRQPAPQRRLVRPLWPG